MAQTIFDKLWASHCVRAGNDGTSLLAIDRLFLHERTGGFALQGLSAKGRVVMHPRSVFCVMDHIVDTDPGRPKGARTPGGEAFITTLRQEAHLHSVQLIDVDDPAQGITHVVSPELGLVQPGMAVACTDSHTCTQGAFGALAIGIGSSEAEHVLATQCLTLKKPPQMRVRAEGVWPEGVEAKDFILALIARDGTDGGRGYAIEFCGPAVEALDMEQRMTLCNMAVEFGAFTGVIAPDESCYAWLRGRKYAPDPEYWDVAQAHWAEYYTDDGAAFDRNITFDVSTLSPMISWGTTPAETIEIDQPIPLTGRDVAYRYMGLTAGESLLGQKIDGAFIGSCTNGRLGDLRRAGAILRGRKVARHVRAICVPGSTAVRLAAEAEGLDEIFKSAGFAWGEAGCGFCFYAGGTTFPKGARIISTTNRNFEDRQGPHVRTHLASPELVALAAVYGHITDPREVS